MNRTQKKKKSRKVLFCQEEEIFASDILDQLQEVFQAYGIDYSGDITSDVIIEEQQVITNSPKSQSFLLKGNHLLSDFHKMLSREIADSLPLIVEEMFEEGREEGGREGGVKVLVIFYDLLGVAQLTVDNSSRILRWIYDIITLSQNQSSGQLSNVLQSIKKRMLKIAFFILQKFKGVSSVEEEDEEILKELVTKLIHRKEKELEETEYEICRLCEGYYPLVNIETHVNQCEIIHQIRYHQGRIEEKGDELIRRIGRCGDSQERGELEGFFNRVYDCSDGKSACFKLKNHLKQSKEVIEDLQKEQIPSIGSLFDILKNYNKLLAKDISKELMLSEKEVMTNKSAKNNLVSISGLGNSSTSLDQDNTTTQQCNSEQTISENEQPSRKQLSSTRLSDFQVIKKLGSGSYSEVYLVSKRKTKDLYAMKVMQFEQLNEERMKAFKREQKIYRSINGQYNVKLYYSFRQENLYFFILDFGCGGTLNSLLEEQIYLEEKYAKNYIANLVLAVESLHAMDIIHRDLKPDNIVVNQEGVLILTDFNLCKLIKEKELERPDSFYGTPDYIAPEVLSGQPATQAMDWFSLGVIAYQMVVGVTPFADQTVQAVFDNILAGTIDWPEVGSEPEMISVECKDFLQKMLNSDPKERLGTHGIKAIKSHPFLEGFNWEEIEKNEFFLVPESMGSFEEDSVLLSEIKSKMRKVSPASSQSEQTIVRYDVLKEATNNKARSRRSSRFKLEKELQHLRFSEPGANKQHSQYNLEPQEATGIRKSCYDIVVSREESIKEQ